MKPHWVRGYEYYDWYRNENCVLLDRKWHADLYLVASRKYKPLRAIFIARDCWYRMRNWAIWRATKMNIIKPTEGEVICWSSLIKWFKQARQESR